MSCYSTTFKSLFTGGVFLLALGTGSALAENLYPQFTDLNASGGLVWGATDIFNDTAGTLEWDESASYKGNEILVATMTGPSSNAGIGISIPASNGENGIDETDCQGPGGACDGTGNVDITNTEPVNPAIVTVNAGGSIPGRLNNGNVLRASVWMRSDPNNPAIGINGNAAADSMPQVEGILKIEAWKEALSIFGDFDGPGDADYGDRIWDQDQQGAAGSFADINADGASGQWGAPVTVTLNTESWTQMVVEYVLDDNPTNTGNSAFPWWIGLDSFTAADVEDIRAVFYVGDWSGRDYTNGGSWWMDNLLYEVFTDQAAADAVDPQTSNPAPVEVVFQPADLNQDGFVDGLDLGIQLGNWGQVVTSDEGELNATPPVDGLDLGILLGAWAPPAAAAGVTVPEPTSLALMALVSVSLLATRRVL
ncbi:MAG: PEP-CTERM sorting domain-containing protein [Pirellulales bacterium]